MLPLELKALGHRKLMFGERRVLFFHDTMLQHEIFATRKPVFLCSSLANDRHKLPNFFGVDTLPKDGC